MNQGVNLRVGLGAGQVAVELREHQFRHRQAERAGDLAETSSATSARTPWPAPRNFSTYSPSSSASTIAGSDPPSRSGVT